jgi:hypothetical protein
VSGFSTLMNVTVADGSVIEAGTGATIDLAGGLGGIENPAITVDGTVTFEGAGAFQIDAPSYYIVAGQGGGTLDNASTIQGAGTIGSGDSTLTLTNQSSGTIDANNSGQQLTINTGSNTVTNLGLMEATNGGTLVIDSTINNAGGTISASGSGAVVQLSGSTINGGTLATSQGGVIEFVGAGNELNGAGTASTSSTSVPVYASSTEWHDSGIRVTAGEQITITASGLISIGTNVSAGGRDVSNETPAGDPDVVTGDIANNPDNFLENNLITWSLIGIISSATPAANAASAFQVGDGTTFTVATSGEL